MYRATTNAKRPLTTFMIECLMESHEREILNLFPCEVTEKGVKGLVNRGLLRADFITDADGKRFMCVFLTSNGRRYLANYV